MEAAEAEAVDEGVVDEVVDEGVPLAVTQVNDGCHECCAVRFRDRSHQSEINQRKFVPMCNSQRMSRVQHEQICAYRHESQSWIQKKKG